VSELKVSVQEVSPVEKRIEVAVPPKIVDDAFRSATQKISRRAKVPGFRPGKIPPQVVEKMFGAQLADEVALEVINKTYFDIIKEHNIRAVDLPKVDNEAAKRGEEFKYTATVETIPPVDLKAYKGLDCKIEKLAVTDDALNGALEQMRESKAELIEVTETRAIKKDDFAIIDLEGKEGGKVIPEMSAKGFTVPVGGGVIFSEIEQALEGTKVGDTREVQVQVPADAQNEKLAGKTFDFSFTVQGLKEKSLPALDDEFAKDLGEYDSLAQLRDKVRADMQKNLEDRVRSTKRERALDALIAANPVEVPAGLAAKEADNLVHRAMHDYERQGIDARQLDTSRLFASFRPVAERNIKTELLLDAIATKENIQIDDAALNQFFEEEAAQRGASVDAIKRAYLQAGADLNDRLRLEKALQLIVSEAKWTEVEPAAAKEAGASQAEE
jgi:trigger factor